MDAKKWRAWLGSKPSIYMKSIDGSHPLPQGVNLLGFAHDALDEVDRLRAELAELRRDAERYRWLRECQVTFTYSESMPFPKNYICGQPVVLETTAFGVRGTLDAASDAAMTGETR